MNCKEAYILMNRSLDGDLSKKEEKHLTEHLDACTNCSAQYRILKSAKQVLPEACNTPCPDHIANAVLANVKREKMVRNVMSISKYFKDWRIYTSLAACVLLVLVIKGGVDKKYREYLLSIDPSQEYVNNLEPFKTAASFFDKEEGQEEEGVPEEAGEEASSGEQDSPPSDGNRLRVTPRPSASPSPAAQAEAGRAPAPSLSDIIIAPPTEKAKEALPVQDDSSGAMLFRSGGWEEKSLNADAAMSAAFAATAETKSTPATNKKKSEALSYTVPAASQFMRIKVTFEIPDDRQKEKASSVFQSSSSGGRGAVRNAFYNSDIQFREVETVIEDYSKERAEYASRVESIKSSLSKTENSGEIDKLVSELDEIKASINRIIGICADRPLEIR